MNLTLAQRLTNYLKKVGEYVPKGELERIVLEKTTYTADNTGRTLRKLAEKGTLLVKQVRGHSHYKFNDEAYPPKGL